MNKEHHNTAQLTDFLVHHLSRIYYGKEHLLEKADSIRAAATNRNLKHAIEESASDISKQMARIELALELLDKKLKHTVYQSINGLMTDAFKDIENAQDTATRDLSILGYMQLAETIEMAQFKLLRMVAVRLKNQQVKQLLRENYDDAKANRTLLLLLTTEHLTR